MRDDQIDYVIERNEEIETRLRLALKRLMEKQ